MKVLIVAKTKYGKNNNDWCIGALSEEGESLRLIYNQGNRFHPHNTEYKIGGLWNIDYSRSTKIINPHVEDVLVNSKKYLGEVTNIRSYILDRIKPWSNNISTVFDGALELNKNSLYVPHNSNLPDRSTWFWLSNVNLVKDIDHWNNFRYEISNEGQFSSVKYIGELDEKDCPETLPCDTLIRLSLSGVWEPPNGPNGFWLQISGWY